MRVKLACLALLASCGGGEGTPIDSGLPRDGIVIDAAEQGPMITSFVPSPAQVPANVPTTVTWNWTYLNEPTLPDPTCSIDKGVGPVIRGQATTVTITGVTTFTLTCSNTGGMASRQVVVGVPPVAPLIATFTATPAQVPSGSATNVTFNWTYTTPPSPAPACSIEHGVGTVTPGTMAAISLTQARTYRLRCTNGQGTASADATVTVNECTAGTDDCGPNATCVDTTDGFSCMCNTGFTGNGDVCSAQVSCGITPALCDANASCVGGNTCVCNAGYVGSGTSCQRLRYTFVTSSSGTGNLSSWTGANGMTGLAAADAVCASRASTAGLAGTYVAWLSDSTSDAYCRVHGLAGKKANNCGLGSLPVAAGPWARPNGTPVSPTIDRMLAPTHQQFFPAGSETSAEVTSSPLVVYTGTDVTGAATAATCNDWTVSVSTIRGNAGDVFGGGTAWTDASTIDSTCDTFGRLRCVETVAGPALPSRHPVAKKAFLTSVTGTGNLSTWADAAGTSGINAADAICQARARHAGYLNAASFKAWMSSSTSVTSRILTNGPWARPDGVVIGTSEFDLTDGRLAAPLYLTETNAYVAGSNDAGTVWTGTSSSGSASFNYCSIWTSATSTGTFGRHDLADFRWVAATTQSCGTTARLYCVED